MPTPIPLTLEKQTLADRILADGWLDETELASLRRQVFADGIVDADEVDLLFYLDTHAESTAVDWPEFFIGALTDFFVWKQFPPAVLSEEAGKLLVDRVTADGKIKAATEFELLRNIIKHAKLVPDDVVCLALEGVKDTVLAGGGTLFGPDRRRAGVMDDGDVEVVRDIIYGIGGGDGFVVSRREAELLFDLHRATRAKRNAPGWGELFVKGIGNFLMFPRRQATVSDADLRRREAWLADRGGNKAAFIAKMGAALGSGAALSEAFDLGAAASGHAVTGEDQAYMQKLDHDAALAEELARVDDDEAAWLLAQIGPAAGLHEDEIALLTFIRENTTAISPALDPIFQAAGL